jgi:hypothetical protein
MTIFFAAFTVNVIPEFVEFEGQRHPGICAANIRDLPQEDPNSPFVEHLS